MSAFPFRSPHGQLGIRAVNQRDARYSTMTNAITNEKCKLCERPLGDFGKHTPLGWVHLSCHSRVVREAYERIANEREGK